MPRLDYVMQGVKRAELESGGGGRERLPITPHILRQLLGVWAPTGHLQDTKLIQAVSTLCFFAFMRAGELSTPTSTSYDGDVHLCVQDISVDDTHFPTVMQVQIKQSKTDPFCKGVIGRTGIKLCPVAAVLDFIVARGSSPGPLFTFQDGSYLTRAKFVDLVREALQRVGVDQRRYCGHSFRIGAATTAAQKGLEDCIIKGARSRLRARALFRILAAYTIIILDNHGVEIKLQRAAIQ